MTKKERYGKILEWFSDNVPVAETELNYMNPYQLLVAVMLSAQCTDKRVNIVTPAFFLRFPDVETLSRASEGEIFEMIKSVSYPNSKTRHLNAAAKLIMERFGGQIPASTDELQLIPGVGRKTANVMASVLYGAPVIAVDTHVFRVSHRLGLSSAKDVFGVEKELTANIPAVLRAKSHHWLILHGRYICKARTPLCNACGLRAWCLYYESLRAGEK